MDKQTFKSDDALRDVAQKWLEEHGYVIERELYWEQVILV
jgi:hypothetical protein